MKNGEPSLIVLTNLVGRIGTKGIYDIHELLRDGKTLDEICRAFPGKGFDPPNLSKKIAKVFFWDCFLHEECAEYLRLLNSTERGILDDERNRLRLITGRINPKA